MDSRDYICAFAINGAAEVPVDFEPPPGLSDLLAGLLLPRSESGQPRRRGYPARILLLTPDGLWVIPHTQAGEQRSLIPLEDLETIECGRILLLGWIGLRWRNVQQVLPYNRRCSRAVEKFLAGLKARWLKREARQLEVEMPSRRDYGTALNRKFEYALEAEMMDEEERPLIRFFQPSIRRVRRRFFKYETWSAGDLILLSQRRVLWITERRGAAYEPYGTVSYSAPLASLVDIRYLPAEGNPRLQIRLRSGDSWGLPLDNGNEADAQAFADVMGKALSVTRGHELLPAAANSRSIHHK